MHNLLCYIKLTDYNYYGRGLSHLQFNTYFCSNVFEWPQLGPWYLCGKVGKQSFERSFESAESKEHFKAKITCIVIKQKVYDDLLIVWNYCNSCMCIANVFHFHDRDVRAFRVFKYLMCACIHVATCRPVLMKYT